MYKLFLFFILFLSFTKNQAQELSIPFEIIDGFPIIHVSIDGKNHQFVFDTGAFMTCINSEVFPNLPVSKTIENIGGIGSERKSINAVNFSFNFSNQNYTNQEVLYTDLSSFSKMSCTNLKISGIIGRDIMENYIVEINPDSKKIVFHTLSTFNENHLIGFTKIKLQKTSAPYLPITIEKQKRYVQFDTGSNGGLSTTNYKLENYIKTTQHISYKSKGSSIGIHGVNNDEDIHYKVYNSPLEVGNLAVKNQVFKTSKNDFNNMGFDFSKQFISYLDLKNHKLFIKQVNQNTESINDTALHNLGFSVNYNVEKEKNMITILSTRVENLVLGDTLISINGETPPKNNCEMYSFLRKFFGSKMKIVIERNNETKEIEIESV
ncbi:aspartyl protease family protein [Chryseobacterium mulctrae]|uniref:aspartyl protease family protein n=1 Tax=Chryseobacterium mulctrae TaxID=2576777 RepID=UPI001116B3FF|nr:aspartyl protease family protein [Chryseobacterium mulctrae]